MRIFETIKVCFGLHLSSCLKKVEYYEPNDNFYGSTK